MSRNFPSSVRVISILHTYICNSSAQGQEKVEDKEKRK